MPTPPEGTPWWAWLLGLLVVVGVPALVTWLVRTRGDVQEIKKEVKNNHESNLRVDLDETRAVAENAERNSADAHSEATLAKESSHRTERLVKDMLATLRAMEHSMDRRDKLHADAMTELDQDVKAVKADLDEHLADIPSILESAFTRHDADHHS